MEQKEENVDSVAENSQELTVLLNWFDQVLLKNRTTKKEHVANAAAFVCATIGDYPAYIFGSGFGRLVSAYFHSSKDATTALKLIFGTMAVAPTVVLFNVATRAGFRDLIIPFSEYGDLFNKRDFKALRIVTSLIRYALALFTGIPFMPYVKEDLDSNWSYLICAMIGCASFAGALRAEKIIFEKYFIMYEAETSKAIRHVLNQRMSQAMQIIQHLPTARLQQLHAQIMSQNELSSSEKFWLLLNPPQIDMVATRNRKKLHPWLSTAIESGVFVMAVGAMYALRIGAQKAAEGFCDYFGIEGDDKSSVQTATSILCISINSLFCGFFASKKFEKSNEAMLNGECCPTVTSATAVGLSGAASLMNVFLAIDGGGGTFEKVLILPSFIIPTAMRAIAIEILLNECSRLYKRWREPESPTTLRATLNHILVLLQTATAQMDSRYLRIMEEASRHTAATNRARLFSQDSISRDPSRVVIHQECEMSLR